MVGLLECYYKYQRRAPALWTGPFTTPTTLFSHIFLAFLSLLHPGPLSPPSHIHHEVFDHTPRCGHNIGYLCSRRHDSGKRTTT